VQLVIESLRPGVVALIRDLNGNHVIQRCLQRLGPEESQFVYDAAAANAMEIATHRYLPSGDVPSRGPEGGGGLGGSRGRTPKNGITSRRSQC